MTRPSRLLRAGLAAGLLAVAACGQRGPLFLPEPAEPLPPAAEDDADPDRDRDDDER